MIFHESPFGDWLDAIMDPPMVLDECVDFTMGDFYRTSNLLHRRHAQEQQRLDRWSNIRRTKRARELDRRRARL